MNVHYINEAFLCSLHLFSCEGQRKHGICVKRCVEALIQVMWKGLCSMQICDFKIPAECQQNLTVSDSKRQIKQEFNDNLSHLFQLHVLVISFTICALLREKSVCREHTFKCNFFQCLNVNLYNDYLLYHSFIILPC